MNQNDFLETLRAVEELAKTSEKALTKKEILAAFDDLELSKEQENMVVEYFQKKRKEQNSSSGKNADELTVSELKHSLEQQKKAEEKFLNSPFVKMYTDDLKKIKRCSKTEKEELISKVLLGEAAAVKALTDQYLKSVITISKRYVLLKVRMEDVIQEGNMGLLMAVNDLLGKGNFANVDAYLKKAIKESIERYVDEQLEDENWENAVLGRANLLGAAKEALAQELFRVPTTKELSEYTHLSEQEIEDIMSLIKEKGE